MHTGAVRIPSGAESFHMCNFPETFRSEKIPEMLHHTHAVQIMLPVALSITKLYTHAVKSLPIIIGALGCMHSAVRAVDADRITKKRGRSCVQTGNFYLKGANLQPRRYVHGLPDPKSSTGCSPADRNSPRILCRQLQRLARDISGKIIAPTEYEVTNNQYFVRKID